MVATFLNLVNNYKLEADWFLPFPYNCILGNIGNQGDKKQLKCGKNCGALCTCVKMVRQGRRILQYMCAFLEICLNRDHESQYLDRLVLPWLIQDVLPYNFLAE